MRGEKAPTRVQGGVQEGHGWGSERRRYRGGCGHGTFGGSGGARVAAPHLHQLHAVELHVLLEVPLQEGHDGVAERDEHAREDHLDEHLKAQDLHERVAVLPRRQVWGDGKEGKRDA